MGAGHQREAVGVVEGFRDVLSEGVAGTSGGDAPPTAVIWVRPQQVTHGALMDRKQEDGADLHLRSTPVYSEQHAPKEHHFL